MSSAVNLYVEFLLNIRRVTIHARLSNSSSKERKAYLSSDRKSLTLKHDGHTASIAFPSGISGKATVHLPIDEGKYISCRLEITEDDKPSEALGLEVANDSPWPASALTPSTRVACRSCESPIISPRADRIWKDLPREDWAETMDLWHCHKPKPEPSAETPAQNGLRGYAASNKPKATDGIGFVDTCHLIFEGAECVGLKVDGDGILRCAKCDSILGMLDGDIEGSRLYKWSLLVQRATDLDWERNPLQNFVCAQLLNLIESQASRRFVAYSGALETANDGLLLWVLIPDIKYCASYVSDGRPRRAMKILFNGTQVPAQVVQTERAFYEELPLPQDVLQKLRDDLQASNDILPESARELQRWRVGLLDRFDPVVDLRTSTAQGGVASRESSTPLQNIGLTA